MILLPRKDSSPSLTDARTRRDERIGRGEHESRWAMNKEWKMCGVLMSQQSVQSEQEVKRRLSRVIEMF